MTVHKASRSVSRGLVGPVGVLAEGRHAGGRLSRRTRATLALSVAAMLACAFQGAVFAGVARAEAPGIVGNGTISSSYFAKSKPLGIAVDNSGGTSSGDLYVTTDNGKEIVKFDASGNPLGSPFGEGFIHTGAAVDPSNGDLYVLNAFFSAEIEIYEPNGVRVGSPFSVPASKNFVAGLSTNVQIAVDSAGDVYVPVVPENEVLEYSSSGALLNTFTGGSGAGALHGPTGVAVDSVGDLWVADTGDNRIEELSPADAPIGEIKSEGVLDSIALDGHGDVLAIDDNNADSCGGVASPCSHLVEYSSAGVQIADVGAGAFGSPAQNETEFFPPMVAVDGASGRVYVSDGSKELVWVYQRPLAPVLGQELAVEVGTSEAKLGALVNPGGIQTTYRFEYLSEAAFQANKESFSGPEKPVSTPFPQGSAGEGFSSRTVWAAAKGLTEGTTYHYRVVVTSGLGTVVGPDEAFTTETAAQTACPNEEARVGFSAALPDCRAYELVSPVSKDTAQPDTGPLETGPFAGGGFGGNVSADNGDRFSYISLEVMPGSQSAGLEFVSTRGANGWSTEDVLPLQPVGERCTIKPEDDALRYSADLSKAVVVVNQNASFSEECRDEVREVVSGEPLGAENLLLRDNENGTYQLIDVTPPGVTPTPVSFVGASADLNVVLFSERAKLTPEAEDNTENLYEWSEGVLRLVKLKSPPGAPVAGSVVSVSPDGSDLFFTAGGNLYVRLNGGERTVQLDEKAPGGTGPGGGGSLKGVSGDGSRVLFTDNATAGLTSDTVPGSGTNLYRYDLSTGQLNDLTPVAGAEAEFVGSSEDGSYVYFESSGVQSGSEANQSGETAQSGQKNLYLDHDGTIAFITHAELSLRSAMIISAANGAFLAFESDASLTGYGNDFKPEIYLYSAASRRFECASCNPDGEAPTGGGTILTRAPFVHVVSEDGQVFFETSEALLPRDTNGAADVYEFDYTSGLDLISPGTIPTSGTYLLGASASGDDVFFLTNQNLVSRDSFQEARKIYDARVDGGFPEPPLPPACTTADACRVAPEPQPSIYGAPSSQTFAGAGNLAPPSEVKPKKKAVRCAKGSVKKKHKCVRNRSKKRAKKSSKSKRGGRS
jgi:hypothetical protein